MSDKTMVIDGETGEVTGEIESISGEIVPVGEGGTLKELVPANRASIISRVPIRVSWDARQGFWSSDMGESDTLKGEVLAATEIYICGDVGATTCYGIGQHCPDHPKTSRNGIRAVMDTEEMDVVFVDAFGVSLIGPIVGMLKRAKKDKDKGGKGVFSFEGKSEYPSKFGRFYRPKLGR